MKIYLWGRDVTIIADELKRRGLVVTNSPEEADLIMTHGGDGSLFTAEQKWPGKLKFPVRDSLTAPLCPKHGYGMQFELLKNGKLNECRLPKLMGIANGRECYGINDVYLHSRIPAAAMRYNVLIDGNMYAREVVSDAVGCSTVHGSTAYYRSITHSIFRVGIGLAFSNSTELVNHIVISEQSIVHINILRGEGVLVSDNSSDVIVLKEDDSAEIRQSELSTPTLGLDIFMCSECRRLRHLLRDTTRFIGGGTPL